MGLSALPCGTGKCGAGTGQHLLLNFAKDDAVIQCADLTQGLKFK